MKKRVITVSSDEEDVESAPKRPRSSAKSDSAARPNQELTRKPHQQRPNNAAPKKPAAAPVTSAELMRKAEACKASVLSEFPEYKSVLRNVVIELSGQMQSSGAKTVYDGHTLKPRCVRLSLPIFSVRQNMETSLVDVMRHELAHAIAGRKAAHGPEWQRVCKRIGGSAALCHTLSCQGEQASATAPARRKLSKGHAAAPSRRTEEQSWKSASDSLISQLIRF